MNKRVNSFSNDVLGDLDAAGIAQAIEEREISVKEVIKAAITRSEKVDPDLNAIVLKLYDEAHKYDRLNKEGAFYGVPTYFKDTDNIKGYPTQMGTGAFNAKKAKRNSKFVNQFLSTGVSFLGKTTLPEFGLLFSTENERWAVTRNPWNTDYTSSSSKAYSRPLFFFHDYAFEAVRIGDWKYIETNYSYTWPIPLQHPQYVTNDFVGKYSPEQSDEQIDRLDRWPKLYHIGDSQHESYNLASGNKDMVESMRNTLTAFRADFQNNPRGWR